jgi:hypothetical protein
MPLSCPLVHESGEPLLCRLADQIRMTLTSQLLMGLRKHFDHRTKNGLRFFPR